MAASTDAVDTKELGEKPVTGRAHAAPGDTVFIGVDLAWQSDRNSTGAVVLHGSRSGAKLHTVAEPLGSTAAVLDFIRTHAGEETVTAIDAPLIIPNKTGMRECERLVTKRYGARDAGCHPSNLKLYPDAGSVRLAEALVADGHVHTPSRTSAASAPVIAEVYPHAAMVALFDLPRTIKYKPKWRVKQQRVGLEILRRYLAGLASAGPPLLDTDSLAELLRVDLEALRGKALKQYEDSLDALMCAYIAYYFWYWEEERTEVFGDIVNGYILNPTLTKGGVSTSMPAVRPEEGQGSSPLDIVRSVIGQPLSEDTAADGVTCLTGGSPAEVVARVTDTMISILEFAVQWEGPQTLVERHIPIGDVHLPGASETDLKGPVSELVAVARRQRRRKFGKCKLCDKSTAPEWMHNDEACSGCAERHLGVVH